MPRVNIGATDSIVLVGYLCAMVAFGIFMGRGSKTSADFIVGSRSLPWYAVLFSIVATETSTVTFLSVPGISFAAGGDLRFLQLALGFIVGRTLIVFWLLPLYFRGKLFTVYQLFETVLERLLRNWHR